MFAYLKGILARKNPVFAVIDCNGVGYEVNIPMSTFDKLPEIGKEIEFQIYFSMTENDGIRLFGFFSVEEKDLFRQLISISKIGPKTALSILSGLSVLDLIQAVQTGNVGLITTIPGMGKKSSERLIIELKDKVGKIGIDNIISSETGKPDIIHEAESALITLGYRPLEVKKTIARLMKDNNYQSSEEVIKATIKSLYQRNI